MNLKTRNKCVVGNNWEKDKDMQNSKSKQSKSVLLLANCVLQSVKFISSTF